MSHSNISPYTGHILHVADNKMTYFLVDYYLCIFPIRTCDHAGSHHKQQSGRHRSRGRSDREKNIDTDCIFIVYLDIIIIIKTSCI